MLLGFDDGRETGREVGLVAGRELGFVAVGRFGRDRGIPAVLFTPLGRFL